MEMAITMRQRLIPITAMRTFNRSHALLNFLSVHTDLLLYFRVLCRMANTSLFIPNLLFRIHKIVLVRESFVDVRTLNSCLKSSSSEVSNRCPGG